MIYQKKRFETYIAMDELLAKYYDFDRTLAKCRACPGFSAAWSCPEFDFCPKDFWKQFTRLHLIVDKISNQGASSPKEAQECVHCNKCARLAGKPCIHPERMRYALESLGIIAVDLVKDQFGFEILWSDGTNIPSYYLLVGGILEK